MVGEFYDYLVKTDMNGNNCLLLNGKKICKRDVETLMHMATCNDDVPDVVTEEFNNLYSKAKHAGDDDDFTKDVMKIMDSVWNNHEKYGIDYAYTEMTNYVNFLVS